jgi:selenide,water dikinase
MHNNEIKLTEYSHGAGCGCKISPQVLDEILKSELKKINFPNLLVGNDERDDAAVIDIGNGMAVVSTTDFFMPIVDDPMDFGKIASINAISDIYAMGAKPLMAIAILGWPINTIPVEYANQVIEGGRAACADAGIPLAGGHSIDSPEPIFGLAVTGIVESQKLKKNGGAKVGDYLYLSKGLGVGILSTAQKKKIRLPEHEHIATDSMLQLNKLGAEVAKFDHVHAVTDVTGFGLLGHLTEMCAASNTTAELAFDSVPILNKEAIDYYLDKGAVPGGTKRNWASYGHKIGELSDYQINILADPQTSGGLLMAVSEAEHAAFEQFIATSPYQATKIGRMKTKGEKLVQIL